MSKVERNTFLDRLVKDIETTIESRRSDELVHLMSTYLSVFVALESLSFEEKKVRVDWEATEESFRRSIGYWWHEGKFAPSHVFERNSSNKLFSIGCEWSVDGFLFTLVGSQRGIGSKKADIITSLAKRLETAEFGFDVVVNSLKNYQNKTEYPTAVFWADK